MTAKCSLILVFLSYVAAVILTLFLKLDYQGNMGRERGDEGCERACNGALSSFQGNIIFVVYIHLEFGLGI
jgi:hypothetical protein